MFLKKTQDNYYCTTKKQYQILTTNLYEPQNHAILLIKDAKSNGDSEICISMIGLKNRSYGGGAPM